MNTMANFLALKKLFKNTTNLLFLITVLSISHTARADEIPTYKIEVIVFESMALKAWTEEFWPIDPALPNTSNSTSVFSRNQKPLWINQAQRDLSNEAARLKRQGYRVLFHEAWQQKAYPNKNSHSVLVEGSHQYGSNLLGTIRLYKTRFAHVNVDLQLDRRIPGKIYDEFLQHQQLNVGEKPTHWRFNLQESRKIRPGELHYIDHPLYGVLVEISKL